MEVQEISLGSGLSIVATTVLLIFAAVYAANALCKVICGQRARMRERYLGRHVVLRWRDLLSVPTWIALEVLCLAGTVLFVLLAAWIAYDTVRDFRDWWHEGARRRR